MKGKIIFFSVFMLALSFNAVAQVKPNMPKSIISTTASLRTFHADDKELKTLTKGELVELYIERMKIVVKIFPNIGLATKPGVTMADLGIQETPENKKSLELQTEATNVFLEVQVDFLRKMLPYADKNQLVSMIMYYEQIIKGLREVE